MLGPVRPSEALPETVDLQVADLSRDDVIEAMPDALTVVSFSFGAVLSVDALIRGQSHPVAVPPGPGPRSFDVLARELLARQHHVKP